MTVLGWILTVVFVVLFISLAVSLRGAPYVPSRARDVREAFDQLYAIGSDDLLVDIGSGDGKVLRMAAQRGARAVGYELNPFLVLLSWWLSRRYDGVSTRLADLWRSQAPDGTTVVYTFGTGRDIERMGSWVEQQATRLGGPIYLISYGFELARPALRSHEAHHLYRIEPLQATQAQV